NDWLRKATGLETATAKTFRPWNGSVAAMETALAEGEGVTIKAMAEAAAEVLHNTATIARNSYIHPDVIGLAEAWVAPKAAGPQGLRMAERSLMGLMGGS
ncbi:MAG: DNA topoisomerase IB, partial [Pseudomonadota bacterium]